MLLASSAFHLFAFDLSKGVLVAPADFRSPDKKAVEMFLDEVANRTQGLKLPLGNSGNPAVRIRRGSGPTEDYSIRTDANGVTISGNDARGVLFGIGHLLRSLEFSREKAELSSPLNVTTSPKYPLRDISSATGPKPIPMTHGPRQCGSSTFATSLSLALTQSS